MRLKALAVKGIGPFERNTVFKIPKGLSVIYGLNRSSGKNSKNSNWCGKSLFFSTISELLYDEPIVGSKQDKIKTGSSALVLQKADNELQLTRKGSKLAVKINGKEQDVYTKTKVQQLVKTYWPLSKEEYETFVHIDSRIPHPLVMGSTADRKNFFSAFFGLDKVDAERKIYQAELKKLDKTREAYAELRSTYALLKRDAVPRAEIAKMQQEKDELQIKFEKLRKETVLAQEKQRLLDSIESIKKNKTTLETKFHIFSQEELMDRIQQYKSTLKELEEKKKLAVLVDSYNKQLETYSKAVSSLPDFCKNIDKQKAEKGASLYEDTDYKYKQCSRQVKEKEESLENISLVKPSVKKPNEFLGELVEKRDSIKHKISHAQKFDKGICPTCGQTVEKVDIPALKKQLDTVIQQIDNYKKWNQYEDNLKEYNAIKESLKNSKELLDNLSVKRDKYLKYYKAYKLLKSLPPKPEAPDITDVETVEYYDEKIQKLQKRLNFVSFMKPYMQLIEEYNALDDKTYPNVDFSQVNLLSDKISILKTKIEMCISTADKLHDVKQRIIAMKEKLKEQKPLEYLVEIYADKQIKKRIIQIIGNRLMALVNKYASAIFNEDYKFELVWDTQIHIMCKRKAGNNVLVSDVRKLSGAESKLFTVILVLSLLSFVPSNRRPNVMILDEPTANFSAETTRCFQDLLQILSQLIESIIVITPRSEDIYPQARCFTVVRDGTSRIVEGHPDTLKV